MPTPIQDRLIALADRMDPINPRIQPGDSNLVRQAIQELYRAWQQIAEKEEYVERLRISESESLNRLHFLMRETEVIAKHYNQTSGDDTYSVFFGDWYGPSADTPNGAIDSAITAGKQ